MGYKWAEFNKLGGPAQSAIVAHYEARTRLESVINHDRRRSRRRLQDRSRENTELAFGLRTQAQSGQRLAAEEPSVL